MFCFRGIVTFFLWSRTVCSVIMRKPKMLCKTVYELSPTTFQSSNMKVLSVAGWLESLSMKLCRFLPSRARRGEAADGDCQDSLELFRISNARTGGLNVQGAPSGKERHMSSAKRPYVYRNLTSAC